MRINIPPMVHLYIARPYFSFSLNSPLGFWQSMYVGFFFLNGISVHKSLFLVRVLHTGAFLHRLKAYFLFAPNKKSQLFRPLREAEFTGFLSITTAEDQFAFQPKVIDRIPVSATVSATDLWIILGLYWPWNLSAWWSWDLLAFSSAP